MLVGIMTMHRVPNYGSFLQAYSLKKMIESLGHEVVFVDYHVDPDIEHRGDAAEIFRCEMRQVGQRFKSSYLGHSIKKVLKEEVPSSRSVMFSCNTMLGVTDKRCYNTECDVLVIGSDEVFNCLQLGPNIGYSLELFGQRANASKVISYAASFGNTTYEKLERYGVADEIGGCLRHFDGVSVRDANSAAIVKTLTGEAPLVHLDPVLVGGVEAESWAPCNEDRFMILYGYAFRFTEDECRVALEFAHSHGLELVALGEDQPMRDCHVRCRPDQVLPYFRSADYVLTDTFHGSIFSIVAHTPFATIPRSDRNGQGGNVQKLTSLLDDLCLSARRINSIDELGKVFAIGPDFESADKIRSFESMRSLNYLRSHLSDGGVTE